jgi:hypothetical protein
VAPVQLSESSFPSPFLPGSLRIPDFENCKEGAMVELHKPMENQGDEANESAPRIAGLQSRCRALTIFVFRENGRIPLVSE